MQVVGECIAGRYRLECPLGEGGMGSVWKALHLELGAPVAVKFQHSQKARGTKAVAQFRREARAAAKLTNPHVVRVLDFGVDGVTPFLVMELLEGESLKSRLERQTSASLDDAAEVVRQAASALDAVHEAGIVHRDLKPSNLFITSDRGREALKLLDFGIAKWFDHDAEGGGVTTESGVVVGSVQYMSPEQARGEDVDRRTDVWGLGVVAYRIVTGILPFEGANVPDTLRRVCIGRFERLTTRFGPGYAALDGVFERAFALDRGERFSSAGELAVAFAEASEGVPHAARRLSTAPAAGGWTFGREGPTQSASASPAGKRTRPFSKVAVLVALGGASLALALTLMPHGTPRYAARTIAPPVVAVPGPSALESAWVTLAVPLAARPPPAALGSGSASVPPRRRVMKPPAAVGSSASSEDSPHAPEEPRTRIDPVFGLEVPRAR